MAIHHIKLDRFAVKKINWQYYGGYRLRIEVAQVVGPDLDPHIFIYQRDTASPYTGSEPCDRFRGVAGPEQIAAMPKLEPDPERYWPFYRLNYVEQDFNSEQEALEIWNIIHNEACILAEAMSKFTELTKAESVWCPAPPEDGAHGSESASESTSESLSESESTSESTSV